MRPTYLDTIVLAQLRLPRLRGELSAVHVPRRFQHHALVLRASHPDVQQVGEVKLVAPHKLHRRSIEVSDHHRIRLQALKLEDGAPLDATLGSQLLSS
jgi:hypothetical protein